jgi:hypothetical protein
MKILVGYKRVVDFNVRIQVKPDGSGVVTDGVKLSANPFDDIALEEALRLREKGVATEVVVATIGPADAQAHLRNGLAMGANRAIHVVTANAVQPLTAARVMLKLIEKGSRSSSSSATGDRRRLQPDRTDAGDAVATAAGNIRFEGRDYQRVARVTRGVDMTSKRSKSTCPGSPSAPERGASSAAGHHEAKSSLETIDLPASASRWATT